MSSPYSAEAEQAVLGSVLIDPAAFLGVQGMLDEDDFYRPDHRLIYGAIVSLARDRKPHDVLCVVDELRRQGKEAEAGGFAYVGQIARETATSQNVVHYAAIVRERAIARRAIQFASELSANCLNRERPLVDLLSDAGRHFGRLEASCPENATARKRLCAIEVHELMAKKYPPREYLLEPIIPTQGLTMVYGPRGLGKTQVSVGIAVAVASGGTFLKWKSPKPAGVLLVDGEMPIVAMQARLADAIRSSDEDPAAELNLCSPDINPDVGMPDLSTVEGQKSVDDLVTSETRLIIVDNLSCLLRTGVENDAESWLPLQSWALRHRAAGRSLLFIHHAGKGGAQRGTSRREDVLDAVVALRKPSDYLPSEGARFEVHLEKGRAVFGKAADPFEAKLQIDARGVPTWTLTELGITQNSQIAEMVGLDMKPAEIAQELGISRATVYRHIKAAAINGSGGLSKSEARRLDV